MIAPTPPSLPVHGLAAPEKDDGGYGDNLMLEADLGQLLRLQRVESHLAAFLSYRAGGANQSINLLCI
jgi:hypothetical protein